MEEDATQHQASRLRHANVIRAFLACRRYLGQTAFPTPAVLNVFLGRARQDPAKQKPI